MPRSLSIETSGRVGSIALADDSGLLAELEFAHGLKHAAEIIPLIDRLCRQQDWRPADIEHIYVSAGPGSFTGLRIGITLAKTLAFATAARIVAVPSVRVLVENAPPDARNVIIVLDAKREKIFTARFERGLAGAPWHEAEPAHLDSLADMIARAPHPVHLLGEGIPFHQKLIPSTDPDIFTCPPETARAHAAVVARLGADLARAGQFADPYRLTPIYIRPPEAEEKFNAAQSKT